MITIGDIKKLREETGVSISECKKALTEARGDFETAKEILRKLGKEVAGKRAEKEVFQGVIDSYIHPNKKIGVLVDLRCESDFVARSDDFRQLVHELCLQIAAMAPLTKDDLFSQPWIKDASKTPKDLLNEYMAKIGEKIVVERFERYEL